MSKEEYEEYARRNRAGAAQGAGVGADGDDENSEEGSEEEENDAEDGAEGGKSLCMSTVADVVVQAAGKTQKKTSSNVGKTNAYGKSVHDQSLKGLSREKLDLDIRSGANIKKGGLLYTWKRGKAKEHVHTERKKIPYWIVPDSMLNDPNIVKKVAEAMGLMEPHLLLRFSRVGTPIERWNNYWDFDKSGDNVVDEDELPFKLPPGMVRDKASVAKYLCSIAQDRVHNILQGVSSACVQAGAWIELAYFEENAIPYGLVDHIGPLLGEAAHQECVIFSTYCLEERRKTVSAKTKAVSDSEEFCQKLEQFAGEVGSSEREKMPKTFQHDITDEIHELELDPRLRSKDLWGTVFEKMISEPRDKLLKEQDSQRMETGKFFR